MNASGSWLSTLGMSLSMIDEKELIEPDEEARPSEKVIGDLSDEEKRLYTYCSRLRAEHSKLEAELHVIGNNKEGKDRILGNMQSLKTKAKIARDMMFNAIQDRFDLWTDNVGIRCGNKVVVWEDDDAQSPGGNFMDFLRGMM